MDSRYRNNIYTYLCSRITENKCYPEIRDLHHEVEEQGLQSSYRSKQCTTNLQAVFKSSNGKIEMIKQKY